MGYTRLHCHFLDLVDFGLALLRCLLAGLMEVCCLCCPHNLAFLLWLAYFMLPPEVSKTFYSLSLRVWTLFSHQQMRSVYGMVHLAYRLVMDCIPWIPWTGTFWYCWSLLCRSCGILSSCGHLLDNYCLCMPRLLGYGSRSCHSCGIFSIDCCIYFPYRLLVIMSSCYYTCLRRLRTYLLCPLAPILSLV
jgi:hypothetical protein